jgi:8-amino-3,8-dideoxy-alpha-D-manno-octulosonate transaminase
VTDERDRLAIDGGAPVRDTPLPLMFPGGLSIDDAEKRAVLDVLNERHLFRFDGPSPVADRVAQFEAAFAERMGAPHAVALSSGTAALHTGLVALGIEPGDEVIVPAYTFIASPAAVVAAGGVPVVAEVDASLTLDPDAVEQLITSRTRAIMPVHMRGAACDMQRLRQVADRHGLAILEDVAQATGASYRGRRLGTLGDVGAYSLQFHKVITSGEGGVLVARETRVYDRARIFHDGSCGLFSHRRKPVSVPFFPGLNYRMGELAGAIASVQLEKLDGILGRMRALKKRIKASVGSTAASKGVSFRRLHCSADEEAALALVMFMPDADVARRVAAALSAENIRANVLFREDVTDLHVAFHWPAFLGEQLPARAALASLALLGRAVHLNVSPLLSDRDADLVSEGITKVLSWSL